MQLAEFGMRFGGGTLPNINFSVPRRVDVAWLGSNGYTKSRLPIKWEMLQPMLNDTQADAAARAAIGEPGAFHAGYQSYITGVLDAHAAAGMKCIIDLHNYCRYRDFVFQPNGSVIGLVAPPDPLVRAFTSDNTQVRERIFALAPGATLTQSNFIDFWTRAARVWKDHPGFGGYGLMNEPHNMPPPGGTVESFDPSAEDRTIWPTFAQAAIDAIRAIDPVNPIYLGGNDFSGAFSIDSNTAFPLAGANIIYEVHMYLDASSSGQRFDFDSEVARGFAVGGSGTIDLNTGVARLKIAVDWAKPRGLKLALTETGMPIDDVRWEEMFRRLAIFARQNDVEFYTWAGGNHWTLQNAAINMTPGWHENRTLEPQVSGVLKQSAGISGATLFDDGPGTAPAGAPVTITVYVRGNLAAPVTLTVSSNNGGTLSKSQLTIAAGSNGQDTYSFTPAANAVTTLTYTVASGGLAPPPPRKVYSLADPVAFADTNLADAALAIIAKYSACKWELADGFTDYMLGSPAAAGQEVRAISDSGYGSSPGNAMEMLNWINTDTASMGSLTVPVMRVTNGRKNSDHSGITTTGFSCRKTVPFPEVQPNPRNRVPYDIQDPHFMIAAVSVPGAGNSGVLFQASKVDNAHASELRFVNSQPQARCVDLQGASVVLTSPTPLPANAPAVVTFTSVPGAQRLRVNSTVVGSGSQTFVASPCDQMLIGWGYIQSFPSQGFGGNIYSVITGKGAPTVAELAVLERYLATTTGVV
jgi:aryl-phospho-beta-D-glucosidase BglC (GH1 family)